MDSKDSATDLSRLHDIVEPGPVSWWPMSIGWWILIVSGVLLVSMVCLRNWKRWRADAFRREALREVADASNAATIAALIRRTALASYARAEIAGLNGDAWVGWLEEKVSMSAPEQVRRLLAGGLYKQDIAEDTIVLRRWAEQWILKHEVANMNLDKNID